MLIRLRNILFRPVFEHDERGSSRDAEERDDVAAIKTYRYLRLGMIVVVVAMLAAVVLVRRTSGCWQGSISAYYYTSARPVFVSAMIAISVALIVIKGSTLAEDLLLNLAGILAPIVAFVPTSYEPMCVPGQPIGEGPGGLPADIVRDAQNNVAALLIAAFVALALGIIVLLVEGRGGGRLSKPEQWGRAVLLLFTLLVLVVGSVLLATDRILRYHGWAAVFLFGFLGLASVVNGSWLWWVNTRSTRKTSKRWPIFAALYIGIGLTMLIAGLIIKFVIQDPWDHRTLVLEVVEIGLFVGIWAVQSFERWGKTLQTATTS